MMIDKQKLLDILTSEIESSTGCTDPGSVCLAVAVAAHTLGRRPEKIDVLVSPNIYKNGVSVGIPGTNRIGLELAAALGALLDEPERGLAILADVTGDIVQQAAAIVSDGRVHVAYGQTPEPLYVRAIVSGGGEEAQAVIRGDYSCVTEILRNGAPVMQAEGRTHGTAVYPLVEYSVQELYETILSIERESFRFLLEDARRNQEAVRRDLEDPELPLGRLLKQRISGQMTGPLAVSAEAQAYTAAGEARMSGLNVTIMAIAGSGNHGITNFVGVLSAAEALGASEEQTAAALAISSMITIYIKAHIKRMTAFCGCGVAAATGMTAAVSYLLGGSYDTAVHAMQTVLGTIGGMFCDGAKISCAYKLSTAASLAVQAAYLAREGCFVPAGVGIIYIILTYIGACGGDYYDLSVPQTTLLSGLVGRVLGGFGKVCMGLAVSLACLTTAIGIGSTGASVINEVSKGRISYKLWMGIACVVGAVFGSFGIQNIINYVTPIFLIMYPICIVLTVLGLVDKWIPNDGVYKFGVAVAGIVSVGDAILAVAPNLDGLRKAMYMIPLAEQGFSWLIPTVIAMVIGGIVYRGKPRYNYGETAVATEEAA